MSGRYADNPSGVVVDFGSRLYDVSIPLVRDEIDDFLDISRFASAFVNRRKGTISLGQ